MMKTKASILLNAILTTILATSLFFMVSGVQVTSAPKASAAGYDPWLDYDENGIINMLDLYNTAIAYGTTGDPTKNVIVAGHANKLAYSVRNVVIPAMGWFDSGPILVDGYSKMTVGLVFACDGPEFDYWLWSGHDNSSFAFLADEFDETALGLVNCKTYDVVNMYIKIRVRNPQAIEGYLSVDVYLIP